MADDVGVDPIILCYHLEALILGSKTPSWGSLKVIRASMGREATLDAGRVCWLWPQMVLVNVSA